MYEDLDVGEETRADSLGLQLSTKEFIKYEITEPAVLDCRQIKFKRKCKM